MTETVKTRTYTSTRRRARALKNRRAIIEAANELFMTRGYRDTSVTEIAERAHVSVDTLYVAVGRKPQLLLAVHDLVLGEMDLDEEARPLVADQRAYVKAVRAEATAAGKIRVYADALARVLPRTAPLMRALLEAAASDPDCRRVWDSVDQRRAANMRLLAADLRSTGELRPDLSDDQVADLIWSMNSPVYFSMLADRGWTAERYAGFVADVWTRTLLTTGRWPRLGTHGDRLSGRRLIAVRADVQDRVRETDEPPRQRDVAGRAATVAARGHDGRE